MTPEILYQESLESFLYLLAFLGMAAFFVGATLIIYFRMERKRNLQERREYFQQLHTPGGENGRTQRT